MNKAYIPAFFISVSGPRSGSYIQFDKPKAIDFKNQSNNTLCLHQHTIFPFEQAEAVSKAVWNNCFQPHQKARRLGVPLTSESHEASICLKSLICESNSNMQVITFLKKKNPLYPNVIFGLP